MRKLNTKEFIEKSSKKHNNKFDYSKSVYTHGREKLIIICPEHGEFLQLSSNHLAGQGCPNCANKNITTEIYLSRVMQKHNNKYKYPNFKYTHAEEIISIECPEHGIFKQRADMHKHGQGCPVCSNNIKLNFNSFIEKINKKHSNKYTYIPKTIKNNKEKISIVCPTHGIFEQRIDIHLFGQGCPKCSNLISKGELELYNFIKDIYPNSILQNNRTILDGLELDIYIPEKNIAIEYDGLYWHNEINKPDKNYHLTKTKQTEENNIKLIHVYEDEWLYKSEIVKSRLKNILGLTETKIFARKCIIKTVQPSESNIFLKNNHIQGFVNSKVNLGLFHNDELVSLMTFGNKRKNLGNITKEDEYELLRFCNKLDTTVIGGANKLFKHFIKTYQPKNILSYADRRWSKGNLYNVLGFEFTHFSPVNYFYVLGDKRLNRFNFRKDILISKYDCPEDISEHEFCMSMGLFRIYDCGNYVFEWKLK